MNGISKIKKGEKIRKKLTGTHTKPMYGNVQNVRNSITKQKIISFISIATATF